MNKSCKEEYIHREKNKIIMLKTFIFLGKD